MKVDMIIPPLGESITEATILKWHKRPGDTVERDEVILEVSTEKVDSEIPAPAAGRLVQILHGEGDVVPIKSAVAVIETEAAQSAPGEPETQRAEEELQGQPAQEEQPAAAEPREDQQAAPAEEPSAAEEPEPFIVEERPAEGEKPSGGRFYSPLVRSLAAKYGMALSELDQVQGSGQGGRLTKQDFMRLLQERGIVEPQPAPQPAAPAPRISEERRPEPPRREQAPVSQAQPPTKRGELDLRPDETVVPMDNIRRSIAEHMVRSKQTSPHVYSVHEVDMSNVSRWRDAHQTEFEQKEGFRLSFTPFILEATVKALLKYPYVNSSVEGATIRLKRHVHLGCAVALEPAGLIVPVIRKAEEKTFVGLARALQDLAARAREKRLLPDDVANGTFTVTNPGVFGTVIGTPIINQPQAGILCIGSIEKRPVVIDDMIAVRRMCYLTLSYDHRVIDGATSGRFLAYIGDYLEQWDMNRSLY